MFVEMCFFLNVSTNLLSNMSWNIFGKIYFKKIFSSKCHMNVSSNILINVWNSIGGYAIFANICANICDQ